MHRVRRRFAAQIDAEVVHVEDLLLVRAKAGFVVAQILATPELCERHAAILIESGNEFYFVIALVVLGAMTNCMHGN